MDPRPAVLAGRHVRLEPLARGHAEELYEAGSDPAQWTYLPRAELTSIADARAWIEGALAAQASGREIAFAIVSLGRGSAVGSTRYLDLRREHRGLEIGWTWLAAS